MRESHDFTNETVIILYDRLGVIKCVKNGRFTVNNKKNWLHFVNKFIDERFELYSDKPFKKMKASFGNANDSVNLIGLKPCN